jgi:hypothetical protein
MQRLVGRYVDDPTSETEVRWVFYRVAAVFAALWVAVVLLVQVALFLWAGESGVVEAGLPGPVEVPLGAALVSAVCIPNAGLVGGWIWNRTARRWPPLTARRGTFLGAVVGLSTSVTATIPFALAFALWDHGWRGFGFRASLWGDLTTAPSVFLDDVAEALMRFPGFLLVGSAVTVVVTLGIPLLLSAAVGRALGTAAERERAT